MIKLTALSGNPIYFRASAITAVLEPVGFGHAAKAAFVCGGVQYAVREDMDAVIRQIECVEAMQL